MAAKEAKTAAVVPMVRPGRLSAGQSDGLRHLLRGLDEEALPAWMREQLERQIAHATAATNTGWRFTMLSREQTEHAWALLDALPAKQHREATKNAFVTCTLNLRQDTGEILLTRDELASKLKVSADHMSAIMGNLRRLGIVHTARRRIPGLRGPGRAVYFINARIAWNGSLAARQEAEANQPELPFKPTVIDGGKA